MHSTTYAAPVSKARLSAGHIVSAIPVLFLLFDSVIKLTAMEPVVESFRQLGYPVSLGLAIGVLELACLALYVVPRTSVLGAILLTGYLGGAVATHVRVGSPLFTHILFPIYVAALIWGGLSARTPAPRAHPVAQVAREARAHPVRRTSGGPPHVHRPNWSGDPGPSPPKATRRVSPEIVPASRSSGATTTLSSSNVSEDPRSA